MWIIHQILPRWKYFIIQAIGDMHLVKTFKELKEIKLKKNYVDKYNELRVFLPLRPWLKNQYLALGGSILDKLSTVDIYHEDA